MDDWASPWDDEENQNILVKMSNRDHEEHEWQLRTLNNTPSSPYNKYKPKKIMDLKPLKLGY